MAFVDDTSELYIFDGITWVLLPSGGGVISDDHYDAASWDGNLDGATKNAIRDKIESILSTISGITSYPSGDATKVGYLTVTSAVDLDQIESDTVTNNAKVSNATHTGEVTGSTALTVDKTAITNKTEVTPAPGDMVLITDASDSDNLKKVNASKLIGETTFSPSQITSDQNDYNGGNSASWQAAHIVLITGDSSIRSITSFEAPTGSNPISKRIANTGSYPVIVSPDNTAGTAANRVSGYSPFIILPGTGIELIYDTTSSRWKVLSTPVAFYHYIKSIWFDIGPGSATAGDQADVLFGAIGTGATVGAVVSSTTLPGYFQCSTGSSATGATALILSKNGTYTAFGLAHIEAYAFAHINTLSTSSERFIAYLQITSTTATATSNSNNTIGIRYSDNVNSGKWEGYSKDNAGTESTVDLGVTVAINTFYDLRMIINKARTEVLFYINGSFCGRLTGNMPNAVACGSRTYMLKTVGTTARTFNIHRTGAFAIHS